MSCDVLLCVQARMSSTRLPGKTLRPFCGQTILEILLTRLNTLSLPLVVLTSTDSASDSIENLASKMDIDVLRGSESDVLSRFAVAASIYKPSRIVRCTADNPLTSLKMISALCTLSDGLLDGLSTFSKTSLPEGLKTEVVPTRMLEMLSNSDYKTPADTEHVTDYFYRTNKTYITHYSSPQTSRNKAWSLACTKTLTVDTLQQFSTLESFFCSLLPYQQSSILDGSLDIEDYLLSTHETHLIEQLCLRTDIPCN